MCPSAGCQGESGRGRREWSVPGFGRDVQAVVEKEPLDRVVLVGSSLVGLVIVEAALRMPVRVAAIVPVDALNDVEAETSAERVEAFLHILATDGGFAAGGSLSGLPAWDAEKVTKPFRRRLLDRLMAKKAISEELVKKLIAWRQA